MKEQENKNNKKIFFHLQLSKSIIYFSKNISFILKFARNLYVRAFFYSLSDLF